MVTRAALAGFLLGVLPHTGWSRDGITLGEAIRKTLEINPDVLMERERVRQSQGRYRTEAGAFDWRVSGAVTREVSRGPTPDNRDIQLITEESYALGLAGQLRSGLLIAPGVTVYQSNNLLTTSPVSIASVNMNLVVPLLRHRGAQYTAARERAARSELESAQSLRTQRIAERIADTAAAFYDCLAASEQLEILKDAERLTGEAMDTVDRMIIAMLLDPADRLQAQAVAASKSAARRAGEQAFYRSRLALAAAVGHPAEELAEAPAATGAFPGPPAPATFNVLPESLYVQRALARRGDYLASSRNIETAEILLHQADNARKMRMDFHLGVGYTGADLSSGAGSRFRALYSNLLGPNVIAGVSLELPFRNDAAQGAWTLREAVFQEARLQAERASIAIGVEILGALEDLQSAVEQTRTVLEGERIFLQALDHEKKKMTTGQSSLTDLLQIQDRYIDIRLAKVRALRDYAVALVRFRLVTGTLLDPAADVASFDLNRLTTLPFSE
jgi:outer membrane protein TolC